MAEFLNKVVDRTLNVFFSKDKTKLYLLIIFVMGLVFRLVNVINAPISIDASGHAIMAVNFIDSGKIATWNQSTGLWHFLTDMFYKFFGVGNFGASFVALIFGSLSVILIFLFTKEMFNSKIGLIAAFLLAVSPFHISETVSEMDVAMMFFVLFGMLFFIKALKGNKKVLFFTAGLCIGTSILIKIYALLFIPALLIYALYFAFKNKSNRKVWIKNMLIFAVTCSIFLIVPLTYNYLLYKDKGITDFIFTDALGLGKSNSDKYYSGFAGYSHEYFAFIFGGSKVTQSSLPTLLTALWPILRADSIIFIFGLIGLLILLIRKNRNYVLLFLSIFIIVFTYLGSTSGLMIKHFIFLPVILAPFSALAIAELSKKINIKILIAIILIFQLFWLYHYSGGHFYERSAMNQLVSYKLNNIDKNSLVVWDARIFRGLGTYMFSDRHYLESSYFPQLINNQESMPGVYQPIEVYFIECLSDDCGWGTIKNQPDFNKSMEDIASFFRNNSQYIASFSDKHLDMPLSFSFAVYKTILQLKSSALASADSTHIFWLDPVGYDEKIAQRFDKYQVNGLFDKILNKLAHFIFYISIFLSAFFIFLLIWMFIMDKQESVIDKKDIIDKQEKSIRNKQEGGIEIETQHNNASL